MERIDARPADALPLKTRLLYGSGTIAFGVKDHGFNALLMLFYNQVVGLPAAWVGAAIIVLSGLYLLRRERVHLEAEHP